ncbi:hypothetical protein FACS1894200_05050 [Spirochaetia bacterium]|nr:hypothetical protein FACS1894200_05050 [Spirochaetia bacterium]
MRIGTGMAFNISIPALTLGASFLAHAVVLIFTTMQVPPPSPLPVTEAKPFALIDVSLIPPTPPPLMVAPRVVAVRTVSTAPRPAPVSPVPPLAQAAKPVKHVPASSPNETPAVGIPSGPRSAQVPASTATTGQSTLLSKAQTESYVKANYTYIAGLIQKKLNYPSQAQQRHTQGSTVIIFTINENGSISNASVRAKIPAARSSTRRP